MKRKFIYIILAALMLASCSNKKQKTIKLGSNCKLNYTLENDRLISIELLQQDSKAILYYPKNGEVEFSISDFYKKCNGIITNEFYSLEISNGEDNICTINKNDNITACDFTVNSEYKSIMQYDVRNKISENYQKIGTKEYLYEMDQEGIRCK